MRIISEKRLREFSAEATGSERDARSLVMSQWSRVVRHAVWNDFSDVRATFNHADVYKNCTIFDIGGNKYRIIAKVAYGIRVVFIRYVLTHNEYDKKKWCDDCE